MEDLAYYIRCDFFSILSAYVFSEGPRSKSAWAPKFSVSPLLATFDRHR